MLNIIGSGMFEYVKSKGINCCKGKEVFIEHHLG